VNTPLDTLPIENRLVSRNEISLAALEQTRPFLLVIAPHAGGALMVEIIARLALRGRLLLIDGGNCFNVYGCNTAIARALGNQTAVLPAILQHIQLARAFTCYQMENLLRETESQPLPTIVLDLLSTFHDESVAARESLQLLRACIAQLRRLNRLAPVAISTRPEALTHRPELLKTLQAAAGQVWTLEAHEPPSQPRLL
jgi:hypothetical protein